MPNLQFQVSHKINFSEQLFITFKHLVDGVQEIGFFCHVDRWSDELSRIYTNFPHTLKLAASAIHNYLSNLKDDIGLDNIRQENVEGAQDYFPYSPGGDFLIE